MNKETSRKTEIEKRILVECRKHKDLEWAKIASHKIYATIKIWMKDEIDKYKKIKLFQFIHNPCIHESAYTTISTHRTKKGAWKSMNKFLNDRFNEEYNFRNMYGKYRSDFFGTWKVGSHESNRIRETELED
jgi:hypothetical protein